MSKNIGPKSHCFEVHKVNSDHTDCLNVPHRAFRPYFASPIDLHDVSMAFEDWEYQDNPQYCMFLTANYLPSTRFDKTGKSPCSSLDYDCWKFQPCLSLTWWWPNWLPYPLSHYLLLKHTLAQTRIPAKCKAASYMPCKCILVKFNSNAGATMPKSENMKLRCWCRRTLWIKATQINMTCTRHSNTKCTCKYSAVF